MIILEGADHVGKTTLAQALAKGLGKRIHHMSKPDADFDHCGGYLSLIGDHIQDRFHLGSVVYGMMLRTGGGFATPERMQLVQRYLRWRGCVTIVLHCQREVLKRRLRETAKDEMYDESQILAANDGYRALLDCSNDGEPWADVAIDVTDRWPSIDDEPIQQVIERWSR